MTPAIALWLVRGVSLGLLVVSHVALAIRARRHGASRLAWLAPPVAVWRGGDRGLALAWAALLALYVGAAAATVALH